MNNMQDLTQKERVDGDLLARLLGQEGCGCEEKVVVSPTLGVSRMSGEQGDSCPWDAADRAHVHGFGVEHGVLAALYLPLNRFDDVYDPDTAFRRGTMFAALDKPFYGDGGEVDCRGN